MFALRSSIFMEDDSGHGGNRRSVQISDLLARANINYSFLPNLKPSTASFFSRFQHSLRLNRYLASSYRCSDKNTSYSHRFFLWENTEEEVLGPKLSRYLPIIACPHNIEAYVHNRSSFAVSKSYLRSSSFRIAKEALSLCHARHIFTIADEDSWLLSNLGISSYVLPYRPSRCNNNALLSIRINRKPEVEPKPKVILLGTAGNPPTMDGMIGFLDYAVSSNLSNWLDIVVVGYGTEYLKVKYGNAIHVLGGLSSEELKSILLAAALAIAPQDYGSGSLTRIPELLTAGIPILASRHAARSYARLPGLYIYQSLCEIPARLIQLLSDASLGLPPLPPPIEEQEDYFMETCLSLC